MSLCRWDSDAGDYRTDNGEPCKRDDYGDPTVHCTARRTCSQHVGPGEQTCARCLARTRTDIQQIVQRAALMLPEAIHTGIESQAANLAGPATDPEAWSWRKAAAKRAHIVAEITGKPTKVWHVSMVEEDDDFHAFTVLTRWAWMVSNAYGGNTPEVWTVTNAADYLTRVLHRIAQDDARDFPRMAAELRKCRSRLESVLRDGQEPERGAPCPTCRERDHYVRLVREYAHWCEDDGCEQFHFLTEDADVWVCPRDKDHWWTVVGFAEEQRERESA